MSADAHMGQAARARLTACVYLSAVMHELPKQRLKAGDGAFLDSGVTAGVWARAAGTAVPG